MQAIREIVKALPTEPLASPEKATSEKPRNAALRRLWARMASIYGHKWTSAYGESCEDATGLLTIPGDTWARGLTGISEQQIASGLNVALLSAEGWPPSLPEFRAMCFGVPSLGQVRHEIMNKQRTAFTAQVWQYLDAYAFAHADSERSGRMLSDAYELAKSHVMSGGQLPQPVAGEIAHEEPKLTPASEHTARVHIAELEALLGTPNA